VVASPLRLRVKVALALAAGALVVAGGIGVLLGAGGEAGRDGPDPVGGHPRDDVAVLALRYAPGDPAAVAALSRTASGA
jgi:hypothetical protein